MKFVLGSASARRCEILRAVGIEFEVRAADVDEEIPAALSHAPEKAAMYLSLKKAEAAASEDPDEIVIAADTVVFADGKILGKPLDEADAFAMLSGLSGKTHAVVTGVTVARGGMRITECEKSSVRFADLTEEQIRKYIDVKKPLDKAGAYGIQEAASLFVSGIEGDYHNIVGLPVYRLGEILRKNFDVELMDEIRAVPDKAERTEFV